MENLDSGVKSYQSKNTLDIIFKNKIILRLIYLTVSLIVLFVLYNFYLESRYAFYIDGTYYSKSQINKLIQLPKSKNSKIDYSKLAYLYYQYVDADIKLKPYYSIDTYNSFKNLVSNEYGLKSSNNNEWVRIETIYRTINSYIDTNLIRGQGKQGYFCVINPNTDNSTDSSFKESANYLRNSVNFNNNNDYSIDSIIKSSSNYSNYSQELGNSFCNNFGYTNLSWQSDVENQTMINAIMNSGKGLSSLENLNSKSLYFYNILYSPNSNNLNSISLKNYINKINKKYYGL